jgi:hypothetical protein
MVLQIRVDALAPLKGADPLVFFVFERKGDPRWEAAGAQKEDAEADILVIGDDMPLLKQSETPKA